MTQHLFSMISATVLLASAAACAGGGDQGSTDGTQRSNLGTEAKAGEVGNAVGYAKGAPCGGEKGSGAGKAPYPEKGEVNEFSTEDGKTAPPPWKVPPGADAKEQGAEGCEKPPPPPPKFTPCKDEPPPPGSKTAPAKTPALETCFWSQIGDGQSCIPYGDLKSKAMAICQSKDAEPRALFPADDCKGGATIAKLECCLSREGDQAPPPWKLDPSTQPPK